MVFVRRFCCTVLDTTRLACNGTVPLSESSRPTTYVALSPPNGWYNYYETQHQQHQHRGSGSTPPFSATCPLTLSVGRGQRLNLTVISVGQYGIQQLHLADDTLLESRLRFSAMHKLIQPSSNRLVLLIEHFKCFCMIYCTGLLTSDSHKVVFMLSDESVRIQDNHSESCEGITTTFFLGGGSNWISVAIQFSKILSKSVCNCLNNAADQSRLTQHFLCRFASNR